MDHNSPVLTPSAPSGIGPLYTTQEVAKMLRVAQRTVQDWIRSGELPAMRYGRLLRIRQADLAAFGQALNQATAPASAEAGS